MTAAMSAGAATVTGGMAKASTALFAGIASLKVQAVRAGNSISIRRVDAEENQGPSAPLARPNLDEAPSSLCYPELKTVPGRHSLFALHLHRGEQSLGKILQCVLTHLCPGSISCASGQPSQKGRSAVFSPAELDSTRWNSCLELEKPLHTHLTTSWVCDKVVMCRLEGG